MTDLRYWDSGVFLAWLLPEPERTAACRGVIRAAEKGDLRIVTSGVTLTEVIKLKGRPPLKAEQEALINKFFQHRYILVRNCDRFVAEYARQLIWEYPALKPKDSIHVATAIKTRLPVLDSYDDGLLALDGKVGTPALRIGEPHVPEQLSLLDKTPKLPMPVSEKPDSK